MLVEKEREGRKERGATRSPRVANGEVDRRKAWTPTRTRAAPSPRVKCTAARREVPRIERGTKTRKIHRGDHTAGSLPATDQNSGVLRTRGARSCHRRAHGPRPRDIQTRRADNTAKGSTDGGRSGSGTEYENESTSERRSLALDGADLRGTVARRVRL